MRINFNVPPYTGKEMDYIKECVENQKICGDGEYTQRANEWFEKKTGVKKCLLTTSCTHATEMAAILAGIKERDEVIMPSYTFVSTANAFVLRGAKVVFKYNTKGQPKMIPYGLQGQSPAVLFFLLRFSFGKTKEK